MALQPGKPLLTIITATFNAVEHLPFTIKSIRAQTYENIQWIVVDGASGDGTVALLKQNEDIIDYWISEPDNGIYEAWNKACLHVRGEWVIFIGAGDELASATMLAKMSEVLATAYPDYEIVYGKLQHLSYKKRVVLEEVGRPWKEVSGRWESFQPALPAHAAVFHHCTLINGLETFEKRFRVAADSHFLLKSILRKEPMYVPVVIDKMPLGGISGRLSSPLAAMHEIWNINKDLGIVPPWKHALYEYTKLFWKIILNKVCSDRILSILTDSYRLISKRARLWTIE